MGKTRRKAANCPSKNKSSSIDQSEVNQIILHSKSEMELHVEKWKEQTNDVIKNLKREMHTVISSLPSELAKMTVEEFIDSYNNSTKELSSSEEKPLKDVENKILPAPHGTCMDDSAKAAPPKSKSRCRKKVPATTRSSRSRRKLETPSSKCPFVMVEGTPMLTKRDTSHLNLSEKPRRMRKTDDISAVQLTLYSDRGSPMMMENMNEEMRRKIQESINMMMSGP